MCDDAEHAGKNTIDREVRAQGLVVEVVERALVLGAGEDLEQSGIECHSVPWRVEVIWLG